MLIPTGKQAADLLERGLEIVTGRRTVNNFSSIHVSGLDRIELGLTALQEFPDRDVNTLLRWLGGGVSGSRVPLEQSASTRGIPTIYTGEPVKLPDGLTVGVHTASALGEFRSEQPKMTTDHVPTIVNWLGNLPARMLVTDAFVGLTEGTGRKVELLACDTQTLQEMETLLGQQGIRNPNLPQFTTYNVPLHEGATDLHVSLQAIQRV